MKEYIDRATAITRFTFEQGDYIPEKLIDGYDNVIAVRTIKKVLRDIPAADVVVRHGRWVSEIHHTYLPVEYDDAGDPILHEYTSYRCSLCGREEAKEEPYCHCGARMDKEDEDETM